LLSHPPPGKGGSSLLVDAFYAASILETLHPEAYATLSRLAIPSHASGSEGTLLRPLAQPVFKHDAVTGEIAQVRWNNEDRGVLGKGWRADEVEAWYDAAGKWEEAVKSADAEYWVQLTPGTMVVIDNWRVMHGRSTFTGQRRMCGAYVGRDDWRSRLETLKRTFADKPKEEEARKEHEIWNVGW
jgi:trimethyllysine dioxygenase